MAHKQSFELGRSTQSLGTSQMESQVFRASSSAYAVLCGPWLLIATLWAYVSMQTGRVLP